MTKLFLKYPKISTLNVKSSSLHADQRVDVLPCPVLS